MSLAWQMVRQRFSSFAGTFLAVLAGVAVVTGATTVYLSSQPQAPERYSAAPVLVQAPSVGTNDYGEPELRAWTKAEATGIAAGLSELPGVAAAAPDPVFYVQRLVGGRAQGDPDAALADGHSWSSAALGGYRLTAGRAPTRDGEVAMTGLAPGDRVDVLTAAGPATWTVTGTTDAQGFHVADAVALRLAGGVRVIGLTVTGDAETVAESARGVVGAAGTVLTGSDRDRLEPEAVSRVRWIGAQLLIALVALGVFITAFVVASTCALNAAQRAREIGLLRTIGATPGQVRRLLYGETMVIAAGAGLVGVPVGALAAPLLAGPLVDAGLEPAGFAVTAQPVAWAAAFVLGIVVALAGAAAAARRSSRVSPLVALREAAADPRAMTPFRWVGGILAVACGVALLAGLSSMPATSRTTAGLGAAMALLTAGALLAPVVIVPLVRAVTWPWRQAATGMLVREGSLVAVRRVASTSAPVLLTVGFTMLLTGMVDTIEKASGLDAVGDIPAATVMTPDGTPGLSEAAVREQQGSSVLPTRVLVTKGGVTKGFDAAGVSAAPERPAPAQAGKTVNGAGVVLNKKTAEELRAATGDVLDLRWADGTTSRLQVRAVNDDAEAALVLPRSLVRQHDPTALTDLLLVHGTAVAAPGAQIVSALDHVMVDIEEEGQIVELFLVVLLGLGVGYTGLAVANTLLMATAARRAEFRAMRLAGATTGQVLKVTSAEAVVAVAVGTLLGAVIAVGGLQGMRAAVESELNQPVALVVPWVAALAVTGLCTLIAVGATAMPVLRRGA